MRVPVDKDRLVAAYERLGNVHVAAKECGISHSVAHRRLTAWGVMQPKNLFTDEDRQRLTREYALYANAGKLGELAAQMGRTKPFICRAAREMGLTDQKRAKPYMAVWKYITAEAAEVVWQHFRKSSLGLGAYCKKEGYDSLGFSQAMRKYFPDEWEAVLELKVPKQTMYRLGRALEYRVRDDLKKRGFFVTRSPQSKSPADLTAIRIGTVLLVQCKRGGLCSVKEWNALFDLAVSIGAIPVLASQAAGGRGIDYEIILDRKDGSKRRQPKAPADLETWKPATVTLEAA